MRGLRTTIVILTGVFSTLLFFRLSVVTGFDSVHGNVGDGCFIMGVVDHWREVFSGNADWDTLPMFWPAKGSLGYSDTFFLHGVVYSILCAFGIDPYYSYTATLMLQGLAGFFLMYALLRRFMNIRWTLAVAISVIFVNLSAVQTSDTHIQMHSIWLCPGIVMLGWKALVDRERTVLWAALCGAALALFFFTVYYAPWFLTFYFCIFACVWLVVQSLFIGPKAAVKNALATIVEYRRALIAFAASFAIGIIPFLMLYIPVMRHNGAWSYGGIASMLPCVTDLVNTGSVNIVWGWMSGAMNLEARENFWELVYGVAPLTMLVFIVATAVLSRRVRAGKDGTSAKIALVFAAAVVVCWLLLVKIDGFSLWKIVFHLVPGAGALRAVYRFDVVLSFFVLLVIAEFFEELASMKKPFAVVAVCILLSAMFVEQFSAKKARDQISRKEQIFFIESVPKPPSDARVFYVTSSNGDRGGAQIASFAIARRTGLKTLNGYSGSWPPEWHLIDIDLPNYEENVRKWLGHADATGLYKYDLDTRTWKTAGFSNDAPAYSFGNDIVKNNLLSVYGENWSGREFRGGAWSCGKKSVIVISLEKPACGTLRVFMYMHGYVPDRRHSQRVKILVNGNFLADLKFNRRMQDRVVEIKLPEACAGAKHLVFEFDLPDARSPFSCGRSDDQRPLGVCLYSFKIFDEKEGGK